MYNRLAGRQRVHFVQVTEQQIMDWQLKANKNGHIACTHGGECLAAPAAREELAALLYHTPRRRAWFAELLGEAG